jgi:uncharacterized protein (TIGR03067 family)
MSARLLFLGSVVLLLGFAPAPFPRTSRPDPSDPVRRLQGDWIIVEYRYGGEVIGDRKEDSTYLSVTKNRWTFSQGGQTRTQWDAQINPTSSPRTLDLRRVGNSAAVLLAIYHFEGNKLTITYADDRRPTGFESAGARCWQMVLKRR